MYLHKTPKLLVSLLPNILWRIRTLEKEIYLTFDDGPVPEVTPWVLEQLKQYNAKATFFMVGDNVQKHKNLFMEVVNQQHTVANHTFNHLIGWDTNNQTYFDNVNKAENLIGSNSTGLFRPPYGRLKWSQYREINRSLKIVMWDVLSGDFDSTVPREECLHKSINSTVPGSVIVFHDSVKAFARLEYVLPRYLEHFSALKFKFKAL